MEIAEAVRSERVAAAFRQNPLAIVVHAVNATLMSLVLIATENQRAALAWLAFALVVAALRLGIWRIRHNHSDAASASSLWGAVSVCGAAAGGLSWGGGAAWLWPPSEPLQLFWVFVIGGMCAGAAALHHAHLPTALAFILPAGVPLALRFALDGTERGPVGAAMIVVFLIAVVISGVRASAYFGDNLRLRFDLARRTFELDASNERLAAEIAEHRATEASLRHAQKMEAVGQLAGGVAHDINNVLQAVSGGAALILRRSSDPAVEHLAGLVADAARRGESVARRLLAFSRRGELRAEALEVGDVLGGLREVLAAALGSTVRVDVDASRKLPCILADRGQLETVLVNLATNARDAMPAGGTLTLAASEERAADEDRELGPTGQGAYVRLTVADTGTGMDMDTLTRATEPFFTTKPQGRGTGLGLAMAQHFAEGSGGRLKIDSELGHGTRVSIWLPAAPIDSRGVATTRSMSSAGRGHPAARPTANVEVLLVDDEPAVLEVLAQQLRDEGYKVVEVSNGNAALALLERGARVDLLVCDLAMPDLDGIAVISEARRRRHALPAILLTGYAGEASNLVVSGALGDGAFALVRKPISGAELANQVAALLTEWGGESAA